MAVKGQRRIPRPVFQAAETPAFSTSVRGRILCMAAAGVPVYFLGLSPCV